MYVDDKFLLGKTDQNSDDFDVLLFANRNLEGDEVIPPNIKIIASSAFNDTKIHKILITKNVIKIEKEFFQ